MIFEIDCERTGLSPERVRWHVLRHWHRRVGSPKKVRKQLVAQQKGLCALCTEPLDGDIHIDHIKPVKEFSEDLSISLTDAILQCWTLENLRATHGKRCNLRRVA
jgi:5-methylcytosine-specific restriction endonuclease McrA